MVAVSERVFLYIVRADCNQQAPDIECVGPTNDDPLLRFLFVGHRSALSALLFAMVQTFFHQLISE